MDLLTQLMMISLLIHPPLTITQLPFQCKHSPFQYNTPPSSAQDPTLQCLLDLDLVYICVSVATCVGVLQGLEEGIRSPGGSGRQIVMNCLTWRLETKLWSFERASP